MLRKIFVFTPGLILGFLLVPLISLAGGSFFIDDTTGFVGIGNTVPQSRLDVSGAMYSRLVTASSTTIDWNQSNVQEMTLTSSPTLTFSNGQAGGKYDLILKQDATGSRTVTWPGSVKWLNGSAPTLSSSANSTNVVNFIYDGSNYFGSFVNRPSESIAFDSSGSVFASATTTISYSHTTSGSNRILLACVFDESGAASNDITSITYGGSAMTLVNDSYSISPGYGAALYELINPPTGSNLLQVVRSSSTNGFAVMGASYTGVDQSSPIVDSQTSRTTSTNVTLTGNTGSVDNAWSVFCGASGRSITASTGTHLIESPSGASGQAFLGDSNSSIHPAGSYSMSITTTAGGNPGYVMASFALAN